MPELPPDEDIKESGEEDDASELLREEEIRELKIQAMKERLRSQSVKKGLPRPPTIPKAFFEIKSKNSNQLLQEAEEMLRQEMISLITNDAVEYPFKQCRLKDRPQNFEIFTEEQIIEASTLLTGELEQTKAILYPQGWTDEEFIQAWKETDEELIFLPSTKTIGRISTIPKGEKVKPFELEYQNLKAQMEKEAARAKRLEINADTRTLGYQKRTNSLMQQIQKSSVEIEQRSNELECFKTLRELEKKAIPSRIEMWSKLVKFQEERERENQMRYQNLVNEKEDLMAAKVSS